MRFRVYVLVIFCLAVACKTEKPVVSIPPNAELHFGSFGGFANARDEFMISPDGSLSHKKNTEGKKLITNIGEKKANELIKEAIELEIDKMNSKHPGNMTYFIQYKTGQEMNEVSWGDKAFPPSKEIKAFYDKLYALRP